MLDTSSPFSPVATAPIAEARLDVATRRLRKAIVGCELAPGEFIHESALAERFGLGRASIRVALTELAAARFVSRHARQGWRIAPIDGALIAAVLDGRRRLEASLAAQSLPEPAGSNAVALLGMLRSVTGRPEPAALATARAAERQLRDLIAAGAGAFARDWLEEIWDHADRIVRMLDVAGHPILPADLGDLVTALIAADSEAASRALAREHQRFADALAHGFLAASAQLSRPPARSARRRSKRRTGVTTADRSPPLTKEQQS
ncbi:MAG TPA: GntR family transcriptional regulator [Bosea sp. (in: a-proteobacteria)]|jgi:DNA-binding GntR family transcriptional regulator|uniref:GntR family transcriptional regulator n=1 Tax=Bosea sp. (in: a-proteobacteria) TaxID=1871050 RepID=UPI002E0D46B2|nr:GntR family transcriptional regulator [Bosea sp. (in: a-proteobacteria)]